MLSRLKAPRHPAAAPPSAASNDLEPPRDKALLPKPASYPDPISTPPRARSNTTLSRGDFVGDGAGGTPVARYLSPDRTASKPRAGSFGSAGDRRSASYTFNEGSYVRVGGGGASGEVTLGQGSLTLDQLKDHAGVELGSTLFIPPPELQLLDTEESGYYDAARTPMPNSRMSTPNGGRSRPTSFVGIPPTVAIGSSTPPIPSTSNTNGSRPGSRSASVTSDQQPPSATLNKTTSGTSSRKSTGPSTPSGGGSGADLTSPNHPNLRKSRSSSSGMGNPPPQSLLSPLPSSPLLQPRASPLSSRLSSSGSVGKGTRSVYRNQDDRLSFSEDAYNSLDNFGDFDDDMSQLGTGYAVASSKRNAEFHAIFKNIPEDDYLIEDYGCALQREILIQGRLYISEHHLSFNANIFGWVTTVTLPFAEVVSVEKRMTAYVIPNAIQVTTLHARHIFASFLSRDTTYDLILNIWRMVHPVVPNPAAFSPDQGLHQGTDSLSSISSSSDHFDNGEESDEEASDDEGGEESRLIPGSRSQSRSNSANVSRNPSIRENGTSGNGNGNGAIELLGKAGGATGTGEQRGRRRRRRRGEGTEKAKKAVHPPTIDRCPILKNLTQLCMDTVFPSAPEKIYNLMFTSGFMKEFWVNQQKLLDLQISDWAPESSSPTLLSRKLSYIKPLSGSIGPKQTKCLIQDETAHVDFDDYVCVITTTRTPDVPAGSLFSVKTRTAMTWAKGNSCRVVVTTGVEWTSRSYLKGIIERSCIDGQKTYHTELEKAMRNYIHLHRSEFLEEGQDPESVSDSVGNGSAGANGGTESNSAGVEGGERRVSSSSLHGEGMGNEQNGSGGVGATSAHSGGGGTALVNFTSNACSAVLSSTLNQLNQLSITSLALAFLVLALVLSNIWTLSSSASSSSTTTSHHHLSSNGKRSAPRGGEPLAPEVAAAVKDALDSYFLGVGGSQNQLADKQKEKEEVALVLPGAMGAVVEGGGEEKKDKVKEAQELKELLDSLTKRLEKLKEEIVE